ncbi:MAG: hypothetical protein LJE69_11305 [Thiohalocapsa sp.]|jgi:hypothetical protein|uniref:DUF6629 family protein n=1 Tax=Thiohalocapsa sp. TaxID=2497641 RepID=UPI0025FE26B7|nr:DUF6629 family protein [Thiohalocapsa sp.]MCG6941821.1 hypothetical protein [Thiohalocapsa sp.]
MFFIVANFTLAGVLLVIGVLTLRHVSRPSEYVFASLPLLFGLHQFVQGLVWLGLFGVGSHTTLHVAATVFVFYAQAVLPLLVPLAVWLIEPRSRRRVLILGLAVLGGLLGAYVAWGLIKVPTRVYVHDGSLVYDNPMTEQIWIAVVYVLTTCGSLILSSSVSIQIFGWLNLVGLIVVFLVAQYAFTALWCLYAALVSVVLYLHFIERRINALRRLREREQTLSREAAVELDQLTRHFPRLRRFLLHAIQ